MPPSDLSQPQIDWINKAAGAVPGMDASLAIETRKQELLDAAREKIDQSVGDIKVGENFKIDTLSGFLGRKITMASIGEDPNEEFDTGHDLKDVTGMKDPEMGKVFAQLMHAQSIVATEVEKLRRAQDTATRKPLFSDKEISEAVWAPLMRRKLVPENAIPDRYSEVARTFSGASGEYETRLSAYTDGLSKYDEAMQRLGIAKDVIDGLAGAASAVTGDLGALGVTKNPYEVAMIIKGVQTTLSGVTTVSKAVLKEDGKLNKKNVEVDRQGRGEERADADQRLLFRRQLGRGEFRQGDRLRDRHRHERPRRLREDQGQEIRRHPGRRRRYDPGRLYLLHL